MIVAAGLTPAWQQILQFDRFQPGEVNRAREAHWCGSGKVANAGIALHHLGGPCRMVSVAGGSTGEAMIREMGSLGVPAEWVKSEAMTRVCTTILDASTGRTTELVQNASPLSMSVIHACIERYADAARGATHVVLSGSLPPDTPPEFYRTLMERTPATAKAVLDCRGPELLAALPLRPTIVKPNVEELGRTFGHELSTDGDIWNAMAELNRLGAEWAVVSQGGSAVRVSSREGRHVLTPAKQPVVNPIGCGDCLAAGIAWGLRDGLSPVDAVRFGMAAAGDNVSQLLPARLDLRRVRTLFEKVRADAV